MLLQLTTLLQLQLIFKAILLSHFIINDKVSIIITSLFPRFIGLISVFGGGPPTSFEKLFTSFKNPETPTTVSLNRLFHNMPRCLI